MGDDTWHSDEEATYEPKAERAAFKGMNTKSTYTNVRKQTYTNSERYKVKTSFESDTFNVDSSLVGRIIGRGGSKIRELETESQAKIKIEKSRDSETSVISVSGTREAKQKVKELIESLIADRPQHSYKGESNSRYQDQSSSNFDNNQDAAYSRNGYNRNSNDKSTNDFTFINDSSAHPYTSGQNANYKSQEPEEPIDWAKAYERSMKLQEEHWAKLPPIYKEFYREDPEIAGMSELEVSNWRKENNDISVERISEDKTSLIKIPNPVHSFEQAFGQYPEILEEIYKQNFTKPSPIQAQAWPVLLSGQDLIGIAQTGTGKTLAFLLPALIHIDGQPIPIANRDGPNVLILAPTRELAIQIDKEVGKYYYKGIKSVCVYGGTSRKEQINTVSKGVQIVIATPGRLNDLVAAGHINIEAITYLVLDEADRMLDMGFEPQIRRSLLEIRPTRQTVMTSATWPQSVQRLAQSYMKNPIQVVVGTLDLAAVHTVTQELIFVNDDTEEKFGILLDFFRNMDKSDKVIVFCSRKATAIHIASDMALLGINYQSIYSGLDQSDREQALEDMRNDEVNILVATDVASRGIDIQNITHIINFDFPHSLEEFVHRVGRTGRAGRAGTAITYMSRKDWANAAGLIEILEEAGQDIPQELINMAERFKKKQFENPRGRGGRGGRGGGGNRRSNY